MRGTGSGREASCISSWNDGRAGPAPEHVRRDRFSGSCSATSTHLQAPPSRETPIALFRDPCAPRRPGVPCRRQRNPRFRGAVARWPKRLHPTLRNRRTQVARGILGASMHLDRDVSEIGKVGEKRLVVIGFAGLAADDGHHRCQVLRANAPQVKVDHTVVGVVLDGLADLLLSLGSDLRI